MTTGKTPLSACYSSIQDWLVRGVGFTLDLPAQRFQRFTPYGSTSISFSTLAGHTVDSFACYAARKGWLPHNVAEMVEQLYGSSE